MNITESIARKCLTTIDAGLVAGLGSPEPGAMCVEAAINFALGRPHGDDPGCVAQSVRQLKITLNDADWSTPAARAAGMRRLALVQLGSLGQIDEVVFVQHLAVLATQVAKQAAGWAAKAAGGAAGWAAKAAGWAAERAAGWAAGMAARDAVLAAFAEAVVGILIEMKAPGRQWLHLTLKGCA